MKRFFALLAALLLLPVAAQAQTAPVQVEFVGTITSSVSDTLLIRTANGTVPWTGPLPDYPYVVGDQIRISFSAQPSGEYLDPNFPYQPADGIYRFSILGRSQLPGAPSLGVASLSGLDVSGPIGPSGFTESAAGLVLTFNSNTGAWDLVMPNGGFALYEFDGPGLTYDRTSNSLALSSTTREPGLGCGELGAGCFGITGTMTSGVADRIPVWGTDGSFAGIFSILWSGNWFVNGQQVGGGGSTDVPEPGQLGLFAMALMAVALRRGRRRLQPAFA